MVVRLPCFDVLILPGDYLTSRGFSWPIVVHDASELFSAAVCHLSYRVQDVENTHVGFRRGRDEYTFAILWTSAAYVYDHVVRSRSTVPSRSSHSARCPYDRHSAAGHARTSLSHRSFKCRTVWRLMLDFAFFPRRLELVRVCTTRAQEHKGRNKLLGANYDSSWCHARVSVQVSVAKIMESKAGAC